MSNPINNQIVDPVALGATAHTSGFVEPNQSSSTSSAIPAASSSTTAPSNVSAPPAVTPATAILGSAGIPAQFGYMGGAFGVTNYSSGAGGLQSSPNVPAPGSSIDPSTGKQFSAGMTRAELEAKKAADLSGREQAARQLAGGLETPGKELPGGWGPTPVVPAPGTSASAPASIYEDVNQVLLKVGSTAYAALPASLKEALSNNPEHADKGKQPAGMPSSNRSSVAVMFDNAKKQTTEVIKTLREDTKAPGPIEAEHNRASLKGGPEGRRTSGDAPSLFGQVKEMFQEAYSGHPAGHPTGATGAATFKTSLPSEEPLGARPGEHVSGVGALPGQASETGVAILPDEKVASGSGSLPTQENQGLLPGEVTAGIGALSVSKDNSDMAGTSGSTSGLKGDSSVADELSTPTALGGGALAIVKDEPSVTGTSGLTSELKNESSLAGTSSTTTGLAPPLPQTDLGHGASEGATDVEAAVGASPHVGATDVESAVGASPDGSAKSSMLSPASAPVPERTDSFASTTAIRHGHEGSHKTSDSSPLSAAPIVAAIDEKSTPVSEPRESEKTLEQKVAESHALTGTASSASPATPSKTTGSAIADSPTTKSSPLAAKSNGQSPVGKTAASNAGHDRTASGSSTKKKAGFMSKLKGEMKVISGKIGGDEAKVQAGERMKHGGKSLR